MTDMISLPRTTVQQALEALCLDAGDAQVEVEASCITALRAALEQPEQEPVVPPELEAHFRHLDAVLEQPEKEPVKRWPFVETPEQFSNRLFEAIREFSSILPAVRHVLIENPPMFTHPPRREWRSLSEEDRSVLFSTHFYFPYELVNAVEAKLKEINT